ncbi:MAG: YaiO family outer membrane beta-barrel protein [Bacteroidales bacterium]
MLKKIYITLIINTVSLLAFSNENVDSLFFSAIEHAQNKNYTEAIQKAEKAFESDTTRYDILVFIANVYAWQTQYDEAEKYINRAHKLNSKSEELYDAWLNILLWSRDYKALLETISLAKSNNYQDDYNISLKTILAYKGLGKYSEGIEYAENNSIILDSAATRNVYYEILRLDKQNFISAYYSLDMVNGQKPGHIAYIDYGFKINRHSLITRLNYSNRFGKNDLQAEADYYHVFSNGNYLYSNYGISIKRELFPTHRAGLEYYLPLSNSIETSLGGRYFNSGTKNAYIITGHIGTYFSNLWLALRSFYIFNEAGNSLTTVVNTRIFRNNPLNYWGIELAYGNSPDERYAVSQPIEIFRLNNYRLKLEKNFIIGMADELKISAGYVFEEYQYKEFRNRYIVELIFKKKL